MNEACPLCENKWCDQAQNGNGCDTYYDGCHCCDLCHGFPKCEHSKWDGEYCSSCDKEKDKL